MKILLHVSFLIILLISLTLSKELTLEEFEDLTALTYYTADLKRVYVCNDYLFYNETKALKYHNTIFNDIERLKDKTTPDGGIKNQLKKMKYKYIIGENKGGHFFEINPFSEKYKKHIWGDCDACYISNTNSDFRKRVLKELNSYRKLHGVPPVSYHSTYNTYAKEEAKNFLKTHKNSSCVHQTKFKCVHLPVPDSYAHFVISSMYEKLLAYYDWKKNVYQSKLDPAIQLIWKKVKYIGIGFAKEDYNIHVFLTFSSKVKDDKDYKKNVFPVKSTFIKKYGKLPAPTIITSNE